MSVSWMQSLGAIDNACVRLRKEHRKGEKVAGQLKSKLAEKESELAELKSKFEALTVSEQSLQAKKSELDRAYEGVVAINQKLERTVKDVERRHGETAEELKAVRMEQAQEKVAMEERLAELEQQHATEVAEWQEKYTRADDLLPAQFDAGCMHVLRVLRQNAVEAGSEVLSFEAMAKIITEDLFSARLRELHSILPYCADDLTLFQEAQERKGEEVWVPPPKAVDNLQVHIDAAFALKHKKPAVEPEDVAPQEVETGTPADLSVEDFTIDGGEFVLREKSGEAEPSAGASTVAAAAPVDPTAVSSDPPAATDDVPAPTLSS